MSTDKQESASTAASTAASTSSLTLSSLSAWEGPKDALENSKKQNKTIAILDYWDVYAPPPSESTKGKIGQALPFLRDLRNHIDFGRIRRISLERHGSNKKSRGSRSRGFTRHFLRISKDYHPNDENGYKTKYLMEVAKFQIIPNGDSGSNGNGDHNPKKVQYTTFTDGENHEGSFIFDNYEVADVEEFQRKMQQAALVDNRASNSKSITSTPKSPRTGRRKIFQNHDTKEQLMPMSHQTASPSPAPSPARPTIGSLVMRRDEEIEKLHFDLRETTRHANTSISIVFEDDDENMSNDNLNYIDNNNDGMNTPNKMGRNTSTDIFLSEKKPAAQSGSPAKSRTKQDRKKRPYSTPGGGGSSSSMHKKKNNNETPTRKDHVKVAGGGLLQPMTPFSPMDSKNNSGVATGSVENNTYNNFAYTPVPGPAPINMVKKAHLKVDGGGLLQDLPPLDPKTIAELKSKNRESIAPVTSTARNKSSNHKDKKKQSSQSPSSTVVSSNISTNTAVHSTATATSTHSEDNTSTPSETNNGRVDSKNCCSSVCHNPALALANAFHVVGIIIGLAMLFYSVALFTYQSDPLIIVAVALLTFSLFILITNCTGMFGVNEWCACSYACGSSAFFILMSMGLGIIVILLNCGLMIVFATREHDLFEYLDENHQKLFLIQDDIDYLQAHTPWIYSMMLICSVGELGRIFLLRKLRRDILLQRRGEAINNDGLTERLLEET